MTRSAALLMTLAAAATGLSGCHSIGPGSIPRDRFDYSEAIADSWKHQILRNLVKIRYMDLPIFLDVAQIVSGYTLETGATLGGSANFGGSTTGSVGLGVSGKFTDRPTITYMPMTGEKFLRGLIDPVPPRSLFYMMQSGYAADFILELGVESLSGLNNRSARAGTVRKADPEFLRVAKLLRQIQDAGAVGLRIEDDPAAKDKAVVFFFRAENLPEDILASIQEVKRLLKLPDAERRFRLVYSPVRGAPQDLAVCSRSILQILTALSTFIDVPKEDTDQGRAVPVPDTSAWAEPLLRVHSGTTRPDDAFVAIAYRKNWFWIDDRDLKSKRTLTTILFLFTLTESGATEQLPLLTIPAG